MILGLLVAIILVLPYSLLFYKKIGFRVRLLFISIIALFIFCLLSTIDFFFNGISLELIYLYELFAMLCLCLNIALIFISWITQKVRIRINKTNLYNKK